MTKIKKIPLFDVDWTLLKGGPVGNKIHHQAFDFALQTVYGLPDKARDKLQNTNGMIDTQIIIEVLKLNHISEEKSKEKIPQALTAMVDYFFQHVDEGIYEPMPGVLDLLSDLKKRNVPMGLLTGNVKEIGWEKVKRAGIKDYFSFGAFGSMAYQRVDLIEIARKEASKMLNQELPANSLVIVGDSPLDIACARGGKIEVIAVGAGHFKAHHLQEADLVVESLLEKDKILRFLGA